MSEDLNDFYEAILVDPSYPMESDILEEEIESLYQYLMGTACRVDLIEKDTVADEDGSYRMDVRVRYHSESGITYYRGSPQFDQEHPGFWAYSSVVLTDSPDEEELKDTAKSMLSELVDQSFF